MLKEMSQWGGVCFEQLQQSDLPTSQANLIKTWSTDVEHHWSHWGGVVDVGCLKDNVEVNDDFYAALLVAGELSARIGMSLLFHASDVRQTCSIVTLQIWLHGLQKGMSVARIHQAWNRALCNPPRFSSLNSSDRVLVWKSLEQWSMLCLDADVPIVKWSLSNVLTTVRFGLSEIWYVSSIRPVSSKGSLEWLTAIQSVEEILQRHLKAASKRLRYQQVDRIVLTVPHIFQNSDAGVREWIAKYILTYEWSNQHEDVDWNKEMVTAIRMLVSKIDVVYAPALTEKLFAQLLIELPDLFVGVSLEQLADVAALPIQWNSFRSHTSIRQAVKGCAYASGKPTQAQLDSFHVQVPVEVRLMTTRGGTWPERRQHIEFATVL